MLTALPFFSFICLRPFSTTVRLTSIYNPQIEAEFTKTSGGSTNLFLGATTSSSSELVVATIKKVMAPLEVGLEFALN